MKYSEEFLTPEEISKILKMNRLTVYQLIKNVDIPAIKIGRTYRIPKNDFEKFLERHRVQK